MTTQFGRKLSLIVAGGQDALELGAFRVVFKARQWDIETPNSLLARVYNLSDATALRLQGAEFTRVVLQAGYEGGSYGVIFDGSIIQPKRGRENATDTYLDLVAADGDEAYNFSIVNASLAAGSTPEDRKKAIVAAMGAQGVTEGSTPTLAGNALPRGKVLHGMARDQMRTLADSTGNTWGIFNGKVNMVPLTGYLPGPAIVLNQNTGMIGMPEQTQDGIRVRALLNPNFKPGQRLQIDNKSIQRATASPSLGGSNSFLNLENNVRITDDGVYKILVVDFTGDSRGNDFYADIICIAVDDSAPPGLVAKGYG